MSDIADMQKARLLHESIIKTNPRHAAGWIGASRLEELDGQLKKARKIVKKGLSFCADSEDLWLEAARLQTHDETKQILIKAVQTIPKSVKLWLAAKSAEHERDKQIQILKRALQFIPDSIKLWKELIELESEEQARILLHKAVDCIPYCLDMWLALAKLETYQNAKVILNRARKNLPTELKIWVHAAKLEEVNGTIDLMPIIKNGIRLLGKYGVKVNREDWLQEARLAEEAGSFGTCEAIVSVTSDYELEPIDKERI